MTVLVDTTIWSLALRRRAERLSSRERELVDEWEALVVDGRAALTGPIRQEILSGLRTEEAFATLQERLGDFRYLGVEPADYDLAARFFNVLRRRGIVGTPTDMLLCALASRSGVPVFTTDQDFDRYSEHLGIRLHRPAPSGDRPS